MPGVFRRKGDARWTAWWFDESHERRTKRAYTDKAESRKLAAMREDVCRKRVDGLTDATAERFAEQGRKPIKVHVDDYFAHCEHVGQVARHIMVKRGHLNRLIEGIGAAHLPDLEPNAVSLHLQGLKREGLAARTINASRAAVIAFVNWCVKSGRVAENRLRVISKLDERKDRRRVRRAMSDDELIRLLDAAGPRRLVYLTAAMTGLRRGELREITWADVDMADGYLRVRIGVGKAAREDFVPLHEQVIEALTEANPADAKPADRVFPTMPTIRTFYLDLERARAAWIKEAEQDANEHERREQSDFLAKVDSAGRWVDLHAMRMTLSTNLAKAGVMPQLAQRIMRHADMRTTLRYYTDLRLADATKAVDALPRIEVAAEATHAVATGTYGNDAMGDQETPCVVDSTGAESDTPNRAFGVTTVHRPSDAALATVDAQPVGNAQCCTTKHGDSSKRANGLEPSTFSLEG